MAHYDEFGNYIGPDLDESEESSSSSSELQPEEAAQEGHKALDIVAPEAVGDVDHLIIIEEEDAQPITEPIIEPEKKDTFNFVEEVDMDVAYISQLRIFPNLCRSISIIGDIHHGKTILCDMMHNFKAKAITSADRVSLHSARQSGCRELRFTDARMDEQERGISIKATPMSILMPNMFDKHYLFNVFDTPGHVNFLDEVSAAIRISDGAVLCVDALQGPMIGLRKAVETLAQENVRHLVLCITCIDRLILELRIPPNDAYYKLRFVLGEMNDLVQKTWAAIGGKVPAVFDPAANNVVFASAQFSFMFTLSSYAKLYADQQLKAKSVDLRKLPFDVETFAQFLWGDIWFDPDTRKFQKTKPPEPVEDDGDTVERTFVDFILKPLYKIFSHVVGEEKPTLQPTLEELGVHLEEEDWSLDTRTLLKRVCGLIFHGARPLVSAVVEHIPDPQENARSKVENSYSGNLVTEVAKAMCELKNDGRCVVHTVKNYHRPHSPAFDVFGRVMCGTLRKKAQVKVLGEKYSLDDDEDMTVRQVERIWIYQARYRVEVDEAPAGSWVLIGGVDASVLKTATIVDLLPNSEDDDIEIFRPLRFPARNVVRVACEPIAPSELPKMIDGLRKVAKSYPSINTHVEDSGAHVLICSGELSADCALHDLRKLYGDLEIRCADPVALVCETASSESTIAAAISTPNRLNSLSITCEPLSEELVKDIDKGVLSAELDGKELSAMLKEQYDWDSLACRSLWAFANDKVTSLLVNDILPSRENTKRRDANLIKDYVVHGFQWATREGPLIEEEVRNVQFKLIDATVAPEAVHRAGGQIIPTARRAAYAGLLSASPRLMEPMLFCEIICPADCVTAVLGVLARRRGHMTSDVPNPATPLETIHAVVPAIDSFGLETDIRTHTAGHAFIQSLFQSWEVLPGDPLDSSIVLRPLEPAPAPHLAREFMLKTRRRKGLSESVNVQRFLDNN